MNSKLLPLTQSRLRELLHYEPETGDFYRISAPSGCNIGDKAGTVGKSGYCRIIVDYRKYQAHRLAYLYMTGEWPPHEIDHINRDRNDNRWCNLREATHSQNAMNSKIRCTNTTGYKGVFLDKRDGKYYARARLNREYFYFGRFDDPYEAHLAYVAGVKRLHGEFARLS